MPGAMVVAEAQSAIQTSVTWTTLMRRSFVHRNFIFSLRSPYTAAVLIRGATDNGCDGDGDGDGDGVRDGDGDGDCVIARVHLLREVRSPIP